MTKKKVPCSGDSESCLIAKLNDKNWMIGYLFSCGHQVRADHAVAQIDSTHVFAVLSHDSRSRRSNMAPLFQRPSRAAVLGRYPTDTGGYQKCFIAPPLCHGNLWWFSDNYFRWSLFPSTYTVIWQMWNTCRSTGVLLLEEIVPSMQLYSLWFPASGQRTYSGPL